MSEENTEKKLQFTNRNLMEFDIDPDERDDSEELVKWLEDNATAPHAEADEFFLWIPPYSGYKRSMRLTYGKDIPDFIRMLLLGAIEVRKNAEDKGYLLIAFL